MIRVMLKDGCCPHCGVSLRGTQKIPKKIQAKESWRDNHDSA